MLIITNTLFDDDNFENLSYDLDEILYSLSNLCRWNGHTRVFFSVLDHTLYCQGLYLNKVYAEIQKKFARNAEHMSLESLNKASQKQIAERSIDIFMHDFPESLISDVNGNLKQQSHMKGYEELETRIFIGMRKHFGITHEYHKDIVKEIDISALLGEGKMLMPYDVYEIVNTVEFPDAIAPKTPPSLGTPEETRLEAKMQFLGLLETYKETHNE